MTQDIRFRLGIDGVQQVQQGASQIESSFDRIGKASTAAEQRASGTFASIAGAAKAVAGLAVAQQLVQAAGAAVRAADAVTVLNNKLALATGSASAAATAYDALYGIAQRSRTSFTELGATYASIARATDGLGVSQQRLLKITEAIGNAMAISGGSAEGMQAALTQLGQGLASGTLRGDELNSVLEQTPRLARAIADGMGVTVGKLRELGQEGKLTAEAILQALESQSSVLAKEVGNSVVTVGQAMTTLSNATTKAIAELDKASGGTSSIASGLQSLSGVIEDVGDRFRRARENGNGFFSSLALAQIMGVAEAMGHVDKSAANVGRRLKEAEAELASVQARFDREGGFYLGATLADLREVVKELRAAKAAQDDLKKPDARDQTQFRTRSQSYAGWESEQVKATQLLSDIRSRALGVDASYLKTVYELNAARQKGLITEKEYIDTVQQLTAATFKKTAVTKQDAKAMDDAVKAYEDLSKSGREWARSVGLTNAALEKELALRRPLTEAERQLVELDQKLASGLLVMTPAIEAAARAEIQRGDALRESVRWQRESASENAQALERLQDQTAALEGRAAAAQRDNDQSLLSVAALREVERAEFQAAAAAKERRAILFDNVNPEIANEYRRQAAALRESAAQAGRAAAIEAGKESIQQWTRTADTITGLITNAIQMGGEEGWDYVVDYIKANAIQALVQYGVNSAGQWLGLANAMGSASAVGGGAGGGSSWLNLLGTAGQMGGGWGKIANTIGGYVGIGTGASALGAVTGPQIYGSMAALEGITVAEGAAAATAAGGSSAAAAIPIIGWIIAAVLASKAAYEGGNTIDMIGADARRWGVGKFESDKYDTLTALGMSEKWAQILSGAPLAARLFGNKASVSGFGIGSIVGGDFVQGTTAPISFGRNILGGGADEGLQDLASRLAGSVSLSASLFGGGLTQDLRVGALTDRDRDNEVAALLGFFGGDDKLIAGTQTGTGAFGAGGPGKAAGKIASDELEGWISEQMPVLIIQGLQQSDLDDRFDEYFDSVAAAKLDPESASQLLETATAVAQLTEAFDPLGGAFDQFSELSVATFEKLAAASGGFEALGQTVGSYYQEFYDQAERTEDAWNSITETLNGVGIDTIPKTKAEFRDLVDSLDDLSTTADQEAFAALMRVAGAFDALTDASDAAAQQLQQEADARMKSAIGLIDQNVGKFLDESELKQYRYGRIAQDLQGAGLAITAKQLADATKEEVLTFIRGFVDLSDGVSDLELAALGAAGALADLKGSADQAAVAASPTKQNLLMSYDMLLDGQRQAREAVELREMYQAITPADLWAAASPAMRDMYTETGQVPEFYLSALRNTIVSQRLWAAREMNATAQASDVWNRGNSGLENLGGGGSDPLAQREAALMADQTKATENLTTSIDRLEQSLNDFIDSLVTGSLSALSPEQRLAEARAQFEETLGLADGGNLGAFEQLDDVASTYLQLQKELTGAATYAPVFDEVLAELKRVKEELAAIKGNTLAGAEASAASGVAVTEAVESSNRLAAQQLGYDAAARGRYVATL